MKTVRPKVPLDESPVKISIWRLGGLKWKTLATRVWGELYEGELLTHSAALSFYFLFALIPLLVFLVTLLGFFVEGGTQLRASLFAYLARIVPVSAFVLISTTLDEIGTSASGFRLWVGLITALWLASSGVAALSDSLNAMYGVRESRPWWKKRAWALGLTAALVILIMSALVLVVYGGDIGETVAARIGQGTLFTTAWTTLQVPVAVLFVLLAFALIYYFAPDLYEQKWYWITPGSLLGVILWLIVSGILRTYLHFWNAYSVTYGSLGAVIVLMLWFYVTGIAILLGGKINAEIEGAAARAGVPEAKLHGEKEPEE
jgi:membrane protein